MRIVAAMEIEGEMQMQIQIQTAMRIVDGDGEEAAGTTVGMGMGRDSKEGSRHAATPGRLRAREIIILAGERAMGMPR